MHIDSMVESGLYGSDHFLLFVKFVVGFLMHYSDIGILVGRTGCNLIIYEKLALDTIKLNEKLIVLFPDVLCNVAMSCIIQSRRNVVSLGLTQSIKMQ